MKSLIRERGEYTVIDKVSAVLDEYKDIYVARFPIWKSSRSSCKAITP